MSIIIFATAFMAGTGHWERGGHVAGFARGSILQTGDKIIERNVVEPSHLDQDINIRGAAALLVHTDGTWTEVEFLCQLNLIDFGSSAELCNSTG